MIGKLLEWSGDKEIIHSYIIDKAKLDKVLYNKIEDFLQKNPQIAEDLTLWVTHPFPECLKSLTIASSFINPLYFKKKEKIKLFRGFIPTKIINFSQRLGFDRSSKIGEEKKVDLSGKVVSFTEDIKIARDYGSHILETELEYGKDSFLYFSDELMAIIYKSALNNKHVTFKEVVVFDPTIITVKLIEK